MSLRKHQRQVQDAVRLSIEEGMESLVCDITPGGGKSLIPMIVQHEMRKAGKRYKLAWVVPRDNLRKQGEAAYSDEDGAFSSRNLLGHGLSVMAVTGPEINPSKGTDGFVTTYDTIRSGASTYLQEFCAHDYILVLDEVHHVAVDDNDDAQREYYKALKPLWDAAKFRVLMTGTLSRSDKKRIAFVPYKSSGLTSRGMDIREVDRAHREYRFITYTREDALREKSIIRLEARHHDGPVQWYEKESGETISIDSIASAGVRDEEGMPLDEQEVRKAIGVALTTDLAFKILDRATMHWMAYREARKWSKMLVVAPNQKSAKEYQKHIELEHGITAGLAITDEPSASASIDRFKLKAASGGLDVLVTVGMAYEGLDVPAVTHIAALTRIRSTEWLDQMTARATRYFHGGGAWETQTAFIYAPDDALMNRFFDAYMEQQSGLSVETGPDDNGGGSGGGSGDDIVPIGSALKNHRATQVDAAVAISAGETEALESLQEQYGQTGSLLDFRRLLIDAGIYDHLMASAKEPTSADAGVSLETTLESKLRGKTPSQQCAFLRSDISKIGNRYAYSSDVENGDFMSRYYYEIKCRFGASVKQLDLDDLKRVWLWAMTNYAMADVA